jgi:DNA-binding transcriptional ArsR family regulator
MNSTTRLIGLALFLATPRAAQVHVVDIQGGPGSAYTQITQAVAAVSQGDTIPVRTGSYDSFTLPEGRRRHGGHERHGVRGTHLRTEPERVAGGARSTCSRRARRGSLLHGRAGGRRLPAGAPAGAETPRRIFIDSYLYRQHPIRMEALDRTLAALADPTRRRIVGHLARGTATVSELVECFELTQPTISSHLKVLERSGLISRTRVAQTRPCKLEPRSTRRTTRGSTRCSRS